MTNLRIAPGRRVTFPTTSVALCDRDGATVRCPWSVQHATCRAARLHPHGERELCEPGVRQSGGHLGMPGPRAPQHMTVTTGNN